MTGPDRRRMEELRVPLGDKPVPERHCLGRGLAVVVSDRVIGEAGLHARFDRAKEASAFQVVIDEIAPAERDALPASRGINEERITIA